MITRYPPETRELPLIAVIIVHWLNVEDTCECLESLREVNYSEMLVVLVNNGSPDFDSEFFLKAYPDVVIVTSTQNLGFTGGNNLGIEFALEQGADFVYLLNNDTVVEQDFLSAMLPAFKDPAVGIAGPTVRAYDHREKIWFSGGLYIPVLGFSYRERPFTPDPPDHMVDFVPGAAMMIRREVFESVGVLWDKLYLYFEDLEFCLRARQSGFRTLLVGCPLVVHKVSGSDQNRGSDIFTPNKAYYFARNTILIQRPKSVGLWFITGWIGQFVFTLPYWLITMLRDKNIEAIPHYFQGLRDGLSKKGGAREVS